jgi:phage recombination protein Bet
MSEDIKDEVVISPQEKRDDLNVFASLPERMSAIESRLENFRINYQNHLARLDSFKQEVKENLVKLGQHKARVDSFSDEHSKFIKKMCAPNATEDEFKRFMMICREYSLDPLKKHAYILKGSAIISIDGYIKIANSSPSFDGMESDTVYEGDTITKRENGSLLITYGPAHNNFEKDKIKGAFCNVYRNDRTKATSAYVSLKEYNKPTDTWKNYTSAMITKTAEVMAIKKAFDLSDGEEGVAE